MQKLLRTIAPIAAAAALAACFPDPALLDDDATDTSAGEDASPDAAPGPDGVEDDGSGECETAADCTHLAGNCLKVLCLANTCATQPDPGASCDDGDPCTKDDLCDGTTCAGTAYTCDDGVACTADECDGAGGCTYPVADGFCRIDGACVTAGDTKEDDPCRICEGGQAWSPNDGATCEDGDPICTTGDTCAGTTCVGGPRPSDADTDWILRPVDVVAPATAAVIGLIGLGEDVVFVSESAGGASAELVDGSRVYPGASIQVFRRSSAGLSEYLALEGLDYARVIAGRISDTGNGRLGFAYRHRGDGELRVGGGSPQAITGEGFEAVFLQTFPASLLFRVPLADAVATSNTARGVVVLSEFTDSFTPPAPAGTVQHTNPGGPAELAVTSISGSGFSDWVAHIGGGRLESSFVCASRDGVVHVMFVHADRLTIVDGLGDTHPVSAPGSDVRASWLVFTATGALLQSSTVVTYTEIDPAGTRWTGASLFPLDCDTNGFWGTLAGHTGASTLPAEVGAVDGTGFTLLRLDVSSGSATQRAVLRGITPMALATNDDGRLWISGLAKGDATWLDTTGAESPAGHGDGDSSQTMLFRSDGATLELSHRLTSAGIALPAGVLVMPSGAVVLGGTTLFAPPTFDGADGSFPLSQAADVAPFLFGLNSANGLECSGTAR